MAVILNTKPVENNVLLILTLDLRPMVRILDGNAMKNEQIYFFF
ncbi:MAG: hypothetical protein ABIN61_05680 [candidate division WOR-3 bacterium]